MIRFFFSADNSHGFQVIELTPPQNMLFPVETLHGDPSIRPIMLSEGNLLPNDESPEIALFYVPSKDQWYKELLVDTDGSVYPVENSDLLFFANQKLSLIHI